MSDSNTENKLFLLLQFDEDGNRDNSADMDSILDARISPEEPDVKPADDNQRWFEVPGIGSHSIECLGRIFENLPSTKISLRIDVLRLVMADDLYEEIETELPTELSEIDGEKEEDDD